MAAQGGKPQATGQLEACDPVWTRVRQEAEEIVSADPTLGGFIYANVLNHGSLEDALLHRLALRLGHADVSGQLMRQAFAEALAADGDIADAVRADIVAVQDRDPACDRYVEPLLYFKGFHAVQAHRLGHRLWHMGRRDFALYLQSRVSEVCGVDIQPDAQIGRGIMIDHATGVVIGGTAVIEDDVSLLHSVTLGGTGKDKGDRHPKVRHGVLIGAGAKVLGNVEIGACSKVASGSVVLNDVPPNRTVAGVPAKVIGFAGCNEPARSMNQMLDSDGE